MQINWLNLTEGPGGIPVPTYGEYGGPGWSGGAFVEADETPDYTVLPEDDLDALFLAHDQAYDFPSNDFSQAIADIVLIQEIQALPEDAVSGEGDLYAGGAMLAMLYQIAIPNDHPELLQFLDLEGIVQDAIDLIAQGSIAPEPEEEEAFVAWLEETGAALAAIDNPVTDQAAAWLEDLAEEIEAADDPVFPIVLEDVFDFDSLDAGTLVTEVEDALDDFGDLLADLTDEDIPLAPAETGGMQQAVETTAHKLGDYFMV